MLNFIIKKFHEHKQSLIPFICIGVTTVFIYLLAFHLAWQDFHLHYKIALTVSYVVAVLFHFTANRYLAFRSHGSYLFRHLIKYILLIIINYTITMVVVHLASKDLGLSPYFGIVIAIGCTVISSYFIAKYWVFRTIEV